MTEKKWYDTTPGVASFYHAGHNIGKAINVGFEGKLFKPKIGSVGGFLSATTLPAIGAATGAYLGGQLDADVGTSALVGAGVGLATLPAIGLMGKGATELGKGYLKMSEKIIDKAINPKTYSAMSKAALPIGGVIASPIMRNLQGLIGLGASMIDTTKDAKSLSDIKLSKLGIGVFGAIGTIEAAKSVYNTVKDTHMGTLIPEIKRSAPQTPMYQNNANATGDLVFALNKLRH